LVFDVEAFAFPSGTFGGFLPDRRLGTPDNPGPTPTRLLKDWLMLCPKRRILPLL